MFGLSFSSHSSTAQLNRHDHHHPITTGSAHINSCVCQTCTVAALSAVSIINHRFFSFSRFCFFSWNCTLPIFGNCFPSSGAEISRKLSEFARLPTQVVWFVSQKSYNMPEFAQFCFSSSTDRIKKTWSPVKKQKARTVHGQWGWTASFFSTLSRNFQIAKASKKIITTTTNWAEQVANHFAAVVFLPFGAEPFCHVLNSVLFLLCLGKSHHREENTSSTAIQSDVHFIGSGTCESCAKMLIAPFWRPSPLILLSEPVDHTQKLDGEKLTSFFWFSFLHFRLSFGGLPELLHRR